MRIPPPTPSTPERNPAASPMPTRARVRSDTRVVYEPVDRSLARLVAPLRADPRHSGVVCDIDGTLAPIVATPDEARVIPEALRALERLTQTYALVACVTGRPAAQARRMVPVDAVAISGNHGLEVWRDGAVHLAPQAAKYVQPMAEALQLVRNDGLLPELGCHIEDKGITFTVHYRGSPRADHAHRYLETQIVPQIERAGLASSFGRMVLEVRPPVAVDKGAAVKRLRGRRHITEILFVGDDSSDVDAFREATVRVAVRSPEAPRALLAAADAVVEGPPDVDRAPRAPRRHDWLDRRSPLRPAAGHPYPRRVRAHDTIAVDVHPAELAEIAPDVVDVYAALRNQFYWADRVIVNPAAAEPEVLEGEIVGLTD